MQLHTLTLAVMGVLLASVSLTANGATLNRSYNNGGTSVSISGNVSPSFRKSVAKFTYLGNNPAVFDRWTITSSGRPRQTARGTMADVLAAQDQAQTDERLRMAGVSGSSVYAIVNQTLTRRSGLYAVAGMYYSPETSSYFVGDLTWWHQYYGDLVFSANSYLPTSSVATSGTFNPLDTTAGSGITATYRYIPNWTFSGYYAFSDEPTGAAVETGLKRSYGGTISHTHSFAARNSLTANVGYSKGEREESLKLNSVARDREGVMAGLSYNYYNLTLGLDGGYAKSDYHGNIIDSAKEKTAGVRVGYDITPRLNTYAYYGKKETESTPATGVTMNEYLLLVNAFQTGGRAIDQRQLFKTIDQDTYGIGMRYRHNSNLSFTATASESNNKYSLENADFAKLKSQNYSVGMSFSF